MHPCNPSTQVESAGGPRLVQRESYLPGEFQDNQEHKFCLVQTKERILGLF